METLRGATILDKRRDALERLDHVRRLLVFEPRGHADMYGCFVVEPNDEGADLGVVFFHNAGYSTACGHGTIALVAWALDEGVVERHEGENRVVVDVPSGRLETWARVEGGRVKSVRFRNVPAFVWAEGLEVGDRVVDVAFGGAFYASLEEKVEAAELPRLIELGRELKRTLEERHGVVHPLEPELRDVYGVTFWQEEAGSPLTQRNVTVFADGEVDRFAVRERNVGASCAARPLGAASQRRGAPAPEHRRLGVSSPGRRSRARRQSPRRRDRGRRERVPNWRTRLHAGRGGSARRRLSLALSAINASVWFDTGPGNTGAIAISSQALPERYTSATLIARGGMGEVYRATDTVLQRMVAVKLLSERHARDEDVHARFRREALAAARLSGAPHVITVFDVGEHETQPYIVMEYLEGGSVFDRLREGPVPPALALKWLAEAGQALDRAHAAGIVHRDVKPANLLLDHDGGVVVTDFGIASTTGFDTLTLPGTVLGTAGYLSPEQARGEPTTAASDRYGLGAVAFELLAGRRPFEGETAATEAFAHVTAPVPSAEKIRPGLPDGVDEVLARALAKNPEERPASCAELVSDLREAFRGAEAVTRVLPPPVATQPSHIGSPPRVMHRRRPWNLAFWVAALALGGGGVALLVSSLDLGGPEATTTTTPPTTIIETTTETETAPPPETTESPPATTTPLNGTALNDEGFALMRGGEYESALPLLEQAVDVLAGTGTLAEAYASYNLAFTRFALGSCEGVLPLLERSEEVQGQRKEIDRLYREVSRDCEDGEDGEEEGDD